MSIWEAERSDEVPGDVRDYLRPSTIHNANAFLVLENDKIIECDNRETLVAWKGKYDELTLGLPDFE
jgi:hypothetical protein